MINGPEGFTPDNEFILGESDVRGFFVAAGFCAHGIAGARRDRAPVAAGSSTASPELDLWHMDIRRFGGQHWRSREWTLARTTEVYATYYDIHYPNEERQAGRPLRTGPAYERLRALGAAFGEKSGWERPNWFEPNADDPRFGGREALERLRPRGWAGQHWSPAIAAEALATRIDAGLFDETSFAKLEVVGPGACAFLDRMAANRVDVPGWADRLHLAAQSTGRDRVRPDDHPDRPGSLLPRDRHRRRPARPGLAPIARARRTATSS
jgi:4-methylaminobutanoate oxidase (formaldehyde-forming)